MKPCLEKSQAKISTATKDGSRHFSSVMSMSVTGEQRMRVAKATHHHLQKKKKANHVTIQFTQAENATKAGHRKFFFIGST